MSEQGGDQEAPDQPAMEEAIKEAMSRHVPRPPKEPKEQLLKVKAQPATPVEKFTERAREALSLARHEATRFNHNYIGTEHILLGLLREGEGVGAARRRAGGRDAGSWRIGRGIDAHGELFGRGYLTVAEIRQLRTEAQGIAQQLVERDREAAAPQSGAPPSGDEGPPAASSS